MKRSAIRPVTIVGIIALTVIFVIQYLTAVSDPDGFGIEFIVIGALLISGGFFLYLGSSTTINKDPAIALSATGAVFVAFAIAFSLVYEFRCQIIGEPGVVVSRFDHQYLRPYQGGLGCNVLTEKVIEIPGKVLADGHLRGVVVYSDHAKAWAAYPILTYDILQHALVTARAEVMASPPAALTVDVMTRDALVHAVYRDITEALLTTANAFLAEAGLDFVQFQEVSFSI